MTVLSGRESQRVTLLRRIARIWSLIVIALVLAVALFQVAGAVRQLLVEGSAGPPVPLREWMLLILNPGGVIASLLLARRHEGAGGALALASLITFYLYFYWLRGWFSASLLLFALLAGPGALFVICWWLERRQALD
ncbi:MAG: hypothetical protein R3300_06385 [Candidatus Promineifilaceae bacterium]|nr:hypothetical protein [Candidatus Promineifilaceae bacterium]